MLDENIINSGQYWQDIIKFIIKFIYTQISIIASIFTIIGITSSGILVKLKNWKDRKATRYIILNPINKSENGTLKLIILFIEFSKAIIPIMIFLGLVEISQYWLNYNRFANNSDGYWLILLSIYTCILCDVIYKTKHKHKLNRIPFIVIYVLLVDTIYFKIITEYFYSCDINTIAVIFFIIFVYNFIIIEFAINWISFNTEYKLKRSKYFELFKVIWGSVFIGVVLYCIAKDELLRVGDLVYIIFLLGWMISCYIEIIIINNIKVDFKINNVHGFEITQKAIFQYEYDKVKYILTNGCTKIVDSEKIQSIDYTTENIIRRGKKKKVTCLLENNDILNFDGYKFTKDLWVSFYKINGNEKNVKIINSKKVKKIIEEEIK